MKALLLGAVLALLVLLAPSSVAAVAAAVVMSPLVWAFTAGLLAQPRIARAARRWAR